MAGGQIRGEDLVQDSAYKVFENLDKYVSNSIVNVNKLEKAIRDALGSSSLTNSTKKGITAIKNTETAIGNLTNASVRYRQQTRTNIQQLQSLNSTYQQQSRLLIQLRDRYKSLEVKKQLGIKLTQQETREYAKLRQQVISLDSALKRTDAAAGQFGRNVGNYPKGVLNLVRGLRSLAAAFGFTSGIYLFAAALRNSFNRVREFDKSMQNLAGVLRTSRSEIKDIETEIIKVAGSSVKTSREVANLAEALATLGLRGEALKDLIKPANDLSIALGTSSEEAAEFLVQNLNAFGDSSKYAAEYADTIAAIRTQTSLDFQRMRDSFQYLAPISRILGKDLAYTGGVIGLLSDNGLKAENAARLLGTAQQKLAKEGKSLTDALNEINKAQSEGATGLELLSVASNLFGKQAAKVAVILATNQDKIEKYADGIRNAGGALDDLVNEQLKSLDAQIKILDSTWERLILTIENGEGSYAKFFKGVTLGLTGWLEELIEIEEAQSKVFTVTGENKSFFDRIKNLSPYTSLVKTDYEELVDLQREFNRYFSALGSETSLSFLKDEIDSLNNEIKNNNKLTDEQKKLYIEQRNRVEDLYNSNKKARNELEAQAYEIVKSTGLFDDFGKKISILSNEILLDFIRQNKDVAKSLGAINEELEGKDFVSLNSLEKKLKDLKDRLGEVDINGDEFDLLKAEIREVEALIEKLTGRTKKTMKEFYEALEFKDFEILSEQNLGETISFLTELRSQAKIGSEEYINYGVQIAQFTRQLEKLKSTAQGVTGVLNDLPFIEQEDENLDYDIKVTLDTVGVQALMRKLANDTKTTVEEIQGYWNQLPEEARTFENFQKFAESYIDVQEDIAERTAEIYQGIQDVVTESVNSIFQLQINKLDEQLQANNDYYDALLRKEGLTDDQRKQIELQREQRENQIRERRQKVEQQQFLFQKLAEVAEVTIDMFKAIAAIKAQAAILASNPVTAPLAGLALSQIPLVLASSGLAIAGITATAIPAFFKGKNLMDDYEGPATWGERRREVKIGADGSVEVSPNRTTPTWVKKDDIITPSIGDFQRRMSQPNSEVFKRVSRSLRHDTESRSRIIFVKSGNIDTKSIEMAILKGFRKAKINNTIINKLPERRVTKY